MSQPVLIERTGVALRVVNNAPKTRNALSPEFYDGLIAALNSAADDPGIAAVVLTGAGGYFCAGGNLNVLKTRAEMSVDARMAAIGRLHEVIAAIRACPRPVIAAIEGGAAGAGASLALACDLIVAARSASFSMGYVRVGLTPDGGGTSFLSEFAPRQLVNEILMLGDRISCERLFTLGAVNSLAEPGQCESVALELAERLFRRGPEALATIKTLAQSARQNDLTRQMQAERVAMANAQGGAEAAEGISAFLAKRAPDFSRFRA